LYGVDPKETPQPPTTTTSASLGGPKRLPPPTEPLLNLGGRIRTLRTRKGLSQAQLGEPYLSRAAVSSIEKGRATPSLRSLSHLAAQLGVSIADLLTEEEEGTPEG
jgi:ribosome-binding protein aMBF1 (putative translation factor)